MSEAISGTSRAHRIPRVAVAQAGYRLHASASPISAPSRFHGPENLRADAATRRSIPCSKISNAAARDCLLRFHSAKQMLPARTTFGGALIHVGHAIAITIAIPSRGGRGEF